jgi:septal ring factor EnvC (AmiA/AmiB activator)
MAKTKRVQAKKTEQQKQQSYWAQLPAHQRVATKLQRAVERLTDYAKQAQRFDAKAQELMPAGQDTGTVSELIAAAGGMLKAGRGDAGADSAGLPTPVRGPLQGATAHWASTS